MTRLYVWWDWSRTPRVVIAECAVCRSRLAVGTDEVRTVALARLTRHRCPDLRP